MPTEGALEVPLRQCPPRGRLRCRCVEVTFLISRTFLLAKFAPDGYLVDTAASYRCFNTAGGQSPSFLDFFIIFPPKSLERLGLAGYLLFRYAGVKER